MRYPLLRLALLGALYLGVSASALRAEDWKTSDGKVYHDVQVIRIEPDAVTILYHDGGARIPLTNLPPDLQKRFNYDPGKAKAAADERKKDDAENGKALQAEMDQASAMRQPGYGSTDACATDSTPAGNDDGVATDAPAHDADHHSIDDLASTMHTLKYDLSDPTHYSIDDLTTAASAMRRDLADPTYHTTAHLTLMMSSLAAEPDPNHHTMSEIGGL